MLSVYGVLSVGMQSQILIFLNVLFLANAEHGTMVKNVQWETRQGTLNGTLFRVDSKYAYKFKKIPFAKPPVGNLRFQRPMKAPRWNGTLDATKYGPSCIQNIYDNDKRLIPNLETTEDCLYLNVFVPNSLNKTNNLAVMVWVHGGSFTNGQGTMFDGSLLALTGNVIVVTINYRLNVFGFFSFNDHNGNFGLYDQQMAFNWVHENIAEYGGNNRKVTIFGESAGSFSVTYHAIIPSNRGLFHRVIAQSGVMGPLEFTHTEQTQTASFQLAKSLNCTNSSAINIECMRTLSTDEVFNAYTSMQIDLLIIADGELVKRDMLNELGDPSSDVYKMFHSIDFLAGTNSGEAGLMYFMLARLGIKDTNGIRYSDLCEKIMLVAIERTFNNCSYIHSKMCEQYLPQASSTVAEETQYAVNFFTDYSFLAGTAYLLDHHTVNNTSSTYEYYFTHLPKWELIQSRPNWLSGPNHASELTFVFGMDWYPKNVSISQQERNLSHRMMYYWTNFANTGNPNGQGGSIWPQYDISNRHYFVLDVIDRVNSSLHRHNMEFWNNRIPTLLFECNHQNPKINAANINESRKNLHATLFLCLISLLFFK